MFLWCVLKVIKDYVVGQHTVGWVMDRATSKRRIHVSTPMEGVVQVLVEVYGQQANVVELDEAGAAYLRDILASAVQRLQGGKDGEGGEGGTDGLA